LLATVVVVQSVSKHSGGDKLSLSIYICFYQYYVDFNSLFLVISPGGWIFPSCSLEDILDLQLLTSESSLNPALYLPSWKDSPGLMCV
jgi:hypothetical protein